MKRSPLKRRTPIKPSGAVKTSSALRGPTIKASLRRLKQSRSTGKPTKAQVERWNRMRELGCVCCRLNPADGRPSATVGDIQLEIHHLLSGGRRIGHDATICLCHYHHQAKRLPIPTHGYSEQAGIFGPSLEREPGRFREVYGREESLLAHQNKLLARRVA